MRRTRTLAVLVLCACGSSPLNSAFGKAWLGTSTVTIPGQAPVSFTSQLNITVSGDNATLTNLCPDGSGSLTATGSGNSAAWSGSVSCFIPGNGCTLTLTYKSTALSLSSDNRTLTSDASGTASGCGLNTTFTVHFVGA
jgi:hypothetical protein